MHVAKLDQREFEDLLTTAEETKDTRKSKVLLNVLGMIALLDAAGDRRHQPVPATE